MRADAIVFGVAGSLFGLIIGWVLGTQNAAGSVRAAAPAAQAAPATAGAPAQAPPPLDQSRVQALQTVAEGDPKNVESRVQLGNLFFDSEQYPQAIGWYEQAFALDPANPNVSTDLGVAYYYTNQPDRALAQFEKSLAADPRHTKTLLNVGIVRAFGKNDLPGAAKAWEEVVALSPDSPEGQAAKKGLEGVRNTAPGTAGK
ncbi:MAG: tetratricopeptide repeat protein [Acidobacteriota bacterium]|nr:tetratricopeptide repeat protein [Acidobacteriota bacterium]